ncbi:MAG TPA: energy-coupling factor transporter transmembrane component T [Acidothermaceae bacterium]
MSPHAGRPSRALHPGAWWAWSLALGAAATRTTNPIVLLLLIAVAAFTVSARRSPHNSRSFGLFLRLGVVVLVARVVFDIVFGAQPIGDVLVRVPTVPLPDWAAGLHLGGNITVQGLLSAIYGGLQLATLLICVGSANALASPRRLLRAMPGALYEAGVAITVALSFAPQLATAAVRVRRARRLRGRPSSGVRSWLGIALPVLEDALERSIELAAAMDSRGFGRRGTVSAARRRLVSSAVVAGLVAVAIAVYELLDATSPTLIGLPLLVLGSAMACGAVLFGGRQPTRTKYRPDSWHASEWIVVASGVAALVGMLLAGRLYPGSLHTTTYPLVVPQLPWPALVGLVLALIPAWATPPQTPNLQGISTSRQAVNDFPEPVGVGR